MQYVCLKNEKSYCCINVPHFTCTSVNTCTGQETMLCSMGFVSDTIAVCCVRLSWKHWTVLPKASTDLRMSCRFVHAESLHAYLLTTIYHERGKCVSSYLYGKFVLLYSLKATLEINHCHPHPTNSAKHWRHYEMQIINCQFAAASAIMIDGLYVSFIQNCWVVVES